jgi:steroid delta-isomerase-like uncharacterized protein
MAAAENKMLIRRLLEDVWWRGDLDLADKLLAANFVRHGPALERETRGAESYRDLVTLFRSALPDLHGDIEAQIAEGDTVVSRWTAQGTHRGEMLGRAPTGKTVTIAGFIMDRVTESKVAEEWASYDAVGLMQQIGAIPMP